MKRKIIPKQKYTTYASFPLVSGDVRAYEIELDLGEDITGAQFKVVAMRGDGTVIDDIGIVENGVARYTIANSMYAIEGELTLRLQVVHNMSVLTDREIVFEVKKGTQDATGAYTVVPINDSVILRMSQIEQMLSGKVDIQDGKELSSNDFSDEYKQKLDSLDETIAAEVEKVSQDVDNLSDSFDGYRDEVSGSLEQKADKNYVDTELDKKANKEDIVNIYKFSGSVGTVEQLQNIGDISPGTVVNVSDTGMNYAWTGTGWDALGGEHKDLSAHDRIDGLSQEVKQKNNTLLNQLIAVASEVVDIQNEMETKAEKTEVENRYTKEETDSMFAESKTYMYADFYSKTAVDAKLSDIKQDVYAMTDDGLSKKADKTYVDDELDKKANKSDIATAYRFRGSVETFEDLYAEYKIVPNGVPIYDGKPWGTFENGCFIVNPIEEDNWGTVNIPIEEIPIKKGYYVFNRGDVNVDGALHYESVDIGNNSYMITDPNQIIKIDEDTTVSGASIVQHSDGRLNGATGTLMFTFCKIDDEYVIDEGATGCKLKSNDWQPQNGNVYNVLKDGMNYAWTGTEWDALGGSHIDNEARSDINNLKEDFEKSIESIVEGLFVHDEAIVSLETQMGNIETALDDIIAIQNSLIGGDSQ